jgi:hypothetical protein
MHEHKGCKKKVKVCSKCLGNHCAQYSCFLFYYAIFHEPIKDINKVLISKAILLTSCKNGQKFQLHSALS